MIRAKLGEIKNKYILPYYINIIMNPYQILNINPNCTKKELRNAYLKLVLKYHPDKSNEPDAEERIKEIYAAYELLNNDACRNEYDSLNNDSKYQYYNEFKKYVSDKYPSLSKIIEQIIQIFYDDENEFKNDFNNFDFEKIYNTVTNKIPQFIQNFDAPIKAHSNSNDCKPTELNIYGTVYSSLKNRYMNKYEKISINRITKDPKILFIPLREDSVVFENEGEAYKNIHGDVIINIIIQNDERFTRIGNDLFTEYEISLYEYLYGGTINFEHIDGEKINLNFKSMIKDVSIITVFNKGLIYIDDEDQQRGNLIIGLKIKNIYNEEFMEKIKSI